MLSINYGDATDTLKSILNKEWEKNILMSICNESKPFCSKIDLKFQWIARIENKWVVYVKSIIALTELLNY